MRHKSFENMECPIARSLERVGEWWTILILRDALLGMTRFDEFQKSLGVAPNILSKRLASMVRSGLLERRRYSERPPRHEYRVTDRGRDFSPVLLTLMAWGNKHFAPEGESVLLVDKTTGAPAIPVLYDAVSGRRITTREFQFRPGPAANERVRRRYGAGEAEGQAK
jgi:DNA-binding HxlR family transcriptional regulator